MERNNLAIILNSLIILILCGILVGAFWVQLVEHEKPCPLCLLQRLGMIGVATGLSLNLLYGIQMSHYGISLLSCLTGGFVALRQISLHVCPSFPEFGVPVLGLSLYTWSFIIFACSVLAISLLLFLYVPTLEAPNRKPLRWYAQSAFVLIFLITVANMITAFMQCGLGVCEE